MISENFSVISGLYFRFSTMPTTMPMNCPKTVAYAAPATSSLGKGPSPKIRIGSKMILVMAPTAWTIMKSVAFPVDCSSRSTAISWKTKTDRTLQISIYW